MEGYKIKPTGQSLKSTGQFARFATWGKPLQDPKAGDQFNPWHYQESSMYIKGQNGRIQIQNPLWVSHLGSNSHSNPQIGANHLVHTKHQGLGETLHKLV